MDSASPAFSMGFEYRYRDAANFKANGRILLMGDLTTAERMEITSKLEGGDLFIAEQLGVPTLYEALYAYSGGPSAHDHCWHEFVGFDVNPPANSGDRAWGSARTLLARFRAVEKWEIKLSPHFCL